MATPETLTPSSDTVSDDEKTFERPVMSDRDRSYWIDGTMKADEYYALEREDARIAFEALRKVA